MLAKVGVEPTGEAFNSIVLDEASNRPFNPMVNAGAIATADLVAGKDFPERLSRMLAMFGRYCGRTLHLDNSVFLSERITGHRNRAIAHLMLNFGMMSERMAESLELYFQQCSVLVTCRDLAMIGAALANGGVNPVTGERAIPSTWSSTCSASCTPAGCTTTRVSGPSASACPPRAASAAASWPSCRVNWASGFSRRRWMPRATASAGCAVCRGLSERFGLHCFESGHAGPSILDQFAAGAASAAVPEAARCLKQRGA